ncbi:MAG: hypothetical protein Q9161_001210 [Pseudevernia consocians]
MTPMEPAYVCLNGWNFSRYECQVAMAIKLYIRNSNNATPSDETVGVIINSLRGQVNGYQVPAPIYNVVSTLQSHRLESHRALYLQVYCARQYWQQEATNVWYAWMRQNDALVQRFVASSLRSPVLDD